MRMSVVWLLTALWCLPIGAAEKSFDLNGVREGQLPAGFRGLLAGRGKPGEWKVVMDDAPSAMAPINPGAPSTSKKPVLAQLSRDPEDERFPMLVYEDEKFADFSLTTKFKTVEGKTERMAGIAFRILNETNFYVMRASSLGNNFRFYKVVNGERGDIIGPEVPVPSGVWHEMTIECKGNKIRGFLNGQMVIPELTDNSFTSGRFGFWTKSDSVSYFADTKIVYRPREVRAQRLVADLLKKYPRLVNAQIYLPGAATNTTRVVASGMATEVGQAGTSVENDVLLTGNIYTGKEKNTVSIVKPLRDRNGDIIAVMRVTMKSFAGQTEQNIIVRGTPLVKEIQAQVQTPQDLEE